MKIVITLNEEQEKRIKALANEAGCPIDVVIKHALQLYEHVLKEHQQGSKLVVKRATGEFDISPWLVSE